MEGGNNHIGSNASNILLVLGVKVPRHHHQIDRAIDKETIYGKGKLTNQLLYWLVGKLFVRQKQTGGLTFCP